MRLKHYKEREHRPYSSNVYTVNSDHIHIRLCKYTTHVYLFVILISDDHFD